MNNNPYGPKATPDFELLKRKARRMSIEGLLWSASDAWEAARCADKMERAGCVGSGKTGGFYRDEASVYETELRKRQEVTR